MSHPDALLVGAGIIGAACALELARGGMKILVVDASDPGTGTTAAGMGHVLVLDDSETQFAFSHLGLKLWRELLPELGDAAEDDPCGTLWIAADDEELEHARARADFYKERGVAAEILDADALAEAEPCLRAGLVGALRIPGDRVIYAPNATRRLLDLAGEAGAEVRTGVEVVAFEAPAGAGEGGIVARTADGERLAAGLAVNAAGIGASRLTPELALEPRKGHLVITDRYPGFCRHQLVELGYLKSAHSMTTESVAFNLQPRVTGQVLVGSSRQLVGLDGRIERRIVEAMMERAFAYVPGLADLRALRTWTGFRPTTPDKLPYIGRWWDEETTGNLWIAAGHEGLGITTATSTARLLGDLIFGREPCLDPEPFAPSRAA